MKTQQTSNADTLDRVLSDVNRNLARFRRYGGEQKRSILETSRGHAEITVTRMGQASVNQAGYKWLATPAATLNEALHQHAKKWAAAHPRRQLANPSTVKGGAL